MKKSSAFLSCGPTKMSMIFFDTWQLFYNCAEEDNSVLLMVCADQLLVGITDTIESTQVAQLSFLFYTGVEVANVSHYARLKSWLVMLLLAQSRRYCGRRVKMFIWIIIAALPGGFGMAAQTQSTCEPIFSIDFLLIPGMPASEKKRLQCSVFYCTEHCFLTLAFV